MLILPGRSRSRIEPVIKEINAINPSVISVFIEMDLASPSSVQNAAQQILAHPGIDHIDVLINCAGVMVCPYQPTEWRAPNGDSIELMLGTNHMGHFLFTKLLLGKIRKAAPGARIVNVSSSGHRFGDVRYDDPGFKVSFLCVCRF